MCGLQQGVEAYRHVDMGVYYNIIITLGRPQSTLIPSPNNKCVVNSMAIK